MLIEGTHARLDGPTYWPLGNVERVAESKAPQWTAHAEDGREYNARSRQLALRWLLDATADDRAAKDAEAAARRAELDADAERQATETAQATRAVTDLIRTIWPACTGPTRLPFTDSSVFMFSPNELHDLLTRLVAPGPRVLPTAEAVKHLYQRTVVLCHVSNATPEDPIPDVHPYPWEFLVDAVAVDYGDDDSVAINFAFDGDRADEFNEIELPSSDRTAMVTRDAVTFVDREGGFLLALTPEEGDTMEIAGLDGAHGEWGADFRDWAIEVANGPEPTFWREGLEDLEEDSDAAGAPRSDGLDEPSTEARGG
ncbi:MAG: hypothetical protein ABSG43_22020 [Solirubrobacteraceae bacterium]